MLRKLFSYLPAILLIGIASSQLYLTQFEGQLTPDKGGGFGLFSTVDRLALRTVRLYGTVDGSEEHLPINMKSEESRPLRRLSVAAKALPTADRLQKVISEVKATRWPKNYESFRVEIRKCVTEKSGPSLKVSYQTIAELSVENEL